MINEIERLKSRLESSKKQYAEIILSIKQACYHKPYGSDDSQLKPEREGDIMKAAFFCANRIKSDRYDPDYNIRQSKEFKSDEPQNYWLFYPKEFDRNGYKTPAIIIRKNNIKLLESLCRKAWNLAASGTSYDFKTDLGLKEWVKAVSCDTILKIIKSEKFDEYCEEVNDKNLKIKDIVIIYPSKNYRDQIYKQYALGY